MRNSIKKNVWIPKTTHAIRIIIVHTLTQRNVLCENKRKCLVLQHIYPFYITQNMQCMYTYIYMEYIARWKESRSFKKKKKISKMKISTQRTSFLESVNGGLYLHKWHKIWKILMHNVILHSYTDITQTRRGIKHAGAPVLLWYCTIFFWL